MKIGQEQQILLELGEYEFCIDLDEVLSIINPPKMVRLPSARGAFIRAFKYQDELGAAVSMRIKFSLPEREDMQSGQILLGRLNGRLAGFWFDKVVQILKLGDGAEWFPIPAGAGLPSPEFDSFVRYRERLIPHTTLMGLLRFDQAEAWKHWVAEQKPRLEAGALEDEVAAAAEAEAAQAAKSTPSLSEEPLISLEEFYTLMDEAEVGDSEEFIVSEPVVVETVEVSGETSRVEGLEMTEMSFAKSLESEAQELQAEEPDEPLPLAVPVNPPEPEPVEGVAAAYQLAVGEAAQEQDVVEEAPVQTPEGEDALFSLERKREGIRKRMNPEADASLGDYSIIKVGDKSLLRILRRWLSRLVLLAILLVIAYGTVQGMRYQGQRGLTLDQVWVRGPGGETEWSNTTKAVQVELQGFWRYLKQHPDPRK